MKRLLFILLLPHIAFLSGCITKSSNTSDGTLIAAEKVSHIQKGKTTRAEIEAMFGKPSHVGMIDEGKRTMTYTYMESHIQMKVGIPIIPFIGDGVSTKERQRIQTLQIVLNKDGIVEDFEFSDDTKGTPTAKG